MLQLIVKGNPNDAHAACALHGVTVLCSRGHERFNETTVYAHDQDEPCACDWFCESDSNNGAPYPIGALLWYGTVPADMPWCVRCQSYHYRTAEHIK